MATSNDPLKQGILDAQAQFWAALVTKDARLFEQILADDFVSRSPEDANQSRASFIQTLISFPATVLSVRCDALEVFVFGDVAILSGVQAADLQFPNGINAANRIAITNVFRLISGHWLMVLAHAVELPSAS